ncbi:aminotransferase class III-fold pyridoxal phosphate-dependent enzyme [Rhodococcus sp. CX]|uniref:aminotransferase class III-fold pyridoxal phosphate-dependent enzyme n=1 Tax=Rhodococcus sp. CX TaxID=2789880 RepID=UPI0027DD4385|nr:aminotransferase class III-fold pyridoxal phosphate-dependent enzyme [Rhodococcus sp. CX]
MLVPGAENSVVLLPYNHIDESVRMIEECAADLAAVIVEPILGGTGMIPATREYLEALRSVTTQHGVVLIFDEVVTFPVGLHGVQGMFGITPDLTTLGKAIGGGLPLGAFGGRADIMNLTDPVIDPTTQMRHATTLGGTPACLAAGLAQVEALTPEVHDHMNALGERLRSGARDMAARLNVPLQVTGVGHVFGFPLVGGPDCRFRKCIGIGPCHDVEDIDGLAQRRISDVQVGRGNGERSHDLRRHRFSSRCARKGALCIRTRPIVLTRKCDRGPRVPKLAGRRFTPESLPVRRCTADGLTGRTCAR